MQLGRVLSVLAYACKGDTHTKRITVTGNDMGSLHTTQFFIQACLFCTSSRISIHRFNAVPYQPTIYLFVAVSIGCIAVPCLEIDKEQG